MENGEGQSQSSLNFSNMSSRIQRKFASKFKSKKKLVQPLMSKWKRRLKSYSLSEVALILFCIFSLYYVNPQFVVFKMISDIKCKIMCKLTTFITSLTIVRAMRGEVKLSNVLNPKSWDPQTCLSLTVTLILVAFFINNIVLDQWNFYKSKQAKQKLVDLRAGRSKCKKVSSQTFETQKRTYTRNQVGKLLNSDEYKKNFSVVKRLHDERTELGSQLMQSSQLSAAVVEDSELFKADFMDTTFDRIDKELKKEQKEMKKSNRMSQSSKKDGPPQQAGSQIR